ncbi:GPI transamidase component PIG-S [Aulographum hederae CBS 113979]|uniref:GPI transamidase component PIG-S n=1 Tax=Aulographum hederae CBS 113979 TaxID=1176131 RepID=A0A6G1HB85_9PEZI|nr:GPI transamidase component PIG-S [Aulographum hederae CBS 113979]
MEASPPKTVSKVVESVKKPKIPPPETEKAIWTRINVILAFWAVVLLMGIPAWLYTTMIYRADLPLQEMMDWAEGKVCRPVFPLRLSVEADSIPIPEAQNLVRITQHALDDLNDFSAHHLRLLLSDSEKRNGTQSEGREQTDSEPVESILGKSEDIALSIRFRPESGISAPRADLHAYAPVLDIFYPPTQMPSASSTSSPLASFVANELQSIYTEEQASLAYLLTANNAPSQKTKILSQEFNDMLARRNTRSFKYASTYHLTFSLFTPSYVPNDWEIRSALKSYMTPLLESLSSISNFTVDSQVQLYAEMPPSMREPELDSSRKAWTMRKEDLSGFINAAEWPLSPSIGAGPTINFILYVASEERRPLLVAENGKSSWLVPQWGGMQIFNPSTSKTPAVLTKDDLRPAMHKFSEHLMSLLGVPVTPKSFPLRLSTLTRVRSAQLMFSASSTMGALARLTKTLPSIEIPDSVAKNTAETLIRLEHACRDLKDGKFHSALENARMAEAHAEKAFFEPSMVGQVYFPEEHKVAVYLPLLGPVAVPLVMAAIKEIRAYRERYQAAGAVVVAAVGP